MPITPSKLCADVCRIFDEVLETGVPAGIERSGKPLKIVPLDPPKRQRADRQRDSIIVGDPEELGGHRLGGAIGVPDLSRSVKISQPPSGNR